jgi:hypothetical protein
MVLVDVAKKRNNNIYLSKKKKKKKHEKNIETVTEEFSCLLLNCLWKITGSSFQTTNDN